MTTYKKVIVKHSRGVRINFLIPLLFHIVKHSRVKIIIDIVKRSGLKNLSLNAVPQKTMKFQDQKPSNLLDLKT